MAKAGDGHRFHVTGLTHDERGYPAMNAEAQEKCVRRLVDKIRNNAEKISRLEESDTEDADVVVVSYGITSRVAVKAIEMAKAEGDQGRPSPADYRLAVCGKAHPRTGRTGEGLCDAGAQLRPDVLRNAARR